ncbi:hypothetical protein B0H16DRAFT_1448262 [Mycena metata]|uniref:Uncharacterized protein n=1 Tax=Mycena metata TaxID=1033252 RepID=A0AAD7K794_9AGAR|nr:hypothetical protein B0H16DRAFT_1448262 [Mycena metata]
MMARNLTKPQALTHSRTCILPSQTKQMQAIDGRMSRVDEDVKEQHQKNLFHLKFIYLLSLTSSVRFFSDERRPTERMIVALEVAPQEVRRVWERRYKPLDTNSDRHPPGVFPMVYYVAIACCSNILLAGMLD